MTEHERDDSPQLRPCIGGAFEGQMKEANYGGGGEFEIERVHRWPDGTSITFTETHTYQLVCHGEDCVLIYREGKGLPWDAKGVD